MFALDESKPVSYGMTGRLFEELYMKRNLVNLNNLFLRTILFSRMLPKHKAALLDHYAQIGQVTALVGENTRDASGFRQADLSLALTSGEMSSFAHFSSVGSRLSSIIDLLRVCRAGLSTNYQTFKMMCQFSLMEFTTMVVLYLNYEELNNTENLYIDLFIMCPIFVTLSLTEPCDTLSKYVPPASLFSRFNMLSMLGLFLIQLSGQIFIVERLKKETFYTDSETRKLNNLTLNHSYNDSKNSSLLRSYAILHSVHLHKLPVHGCGDRHKHFQTLQERVLHQSLPCGKCAATECLQLCNSVHPTDRPEIDGHRPEQHRLVRVRGVLGQHHLLGDVRIRTSARMAGLEIPRKTVKLLLTIYLSIWP